MHRLIKELKGVGWAKGENIAKKFLNIPALLQATEEELMEVEGIGKVLAESILKELKGQCT
ncbi:hypothetical protein LCGC14_2744770 [marine sediment metagenome]|uniref:Helix-hairpin-helix DNA-binding motif class 1 domain-containing protein n=1 Tax=marine sediment metagenome TaxID=412755 RepID=A0A0F9BV47_9ZZZZ